ncbi:TlpA family protein disulfide reductase [Mucilaginibacter sp. RCC_168]|uniref:TlpA family protein disulfide reductase n=1 Tax=Mucilaginibacter sp. RCC_168 TaxID=3239221 RepID=UPI0035252DA2
MKRIFGFLALLCLFLGVGAQENIGDRGIMIGQQVPDVLVKGVIGLKLDGRAVNSFRFSELHGRFVILDFWATWCAPCRAMVPMMDSLQRAMGDVLIILPVTYQSASVVAPVLAEMQKVKNFALPGVTNDKVLNDLFPHRYLPHYVWIDAKGVVVAITEEKQLTEKNLRAAISGKPLQMEAKRDLVIPYDKEKLLFTAGNGGNGSAVSYHATLSAYVPGLAPGMDMTLPDSMKGQRFTVRNVPFTWLLRMAYSDHNRWFTDARIRLLSADSGRMTTQLAGQAYDGWLADGNGKCYELLVPPGLVRSGFDIMQEDVKRLYPRYHVAVERTETMSLVLVRTSAEDKLHTTGGESVVDIGPYACELHNVKLSHLVKRLEVQYLQGLPLPITDETGYTDPVDISLHTQLYKVEDLNRELKKYDLQFVRRKAMVDLLVVRDTAHQ